MTAWGADRLKAEQADLSKNWEHPLPRREGSQSEGARCRDVTGCLADFSPGGRPEGPPSSVPRPGSALGPVPPQESAPRGSAQARG